jgi:hypothetical protein
VSNSHRVDPSSVTHRQVQMLRFDESLVQQSLLYIFLIELDLAGVFEQLSVKILHYTVLNAFSIVLCLFMSVYRKC